jgi:tetratricopeptide (TPR) repeat protein
MEASPMSEASELVGVLLDRAAPLEARDDAAAALSTHDAAEGEDALVSVACDASLPEALLDRCGASIAAIWARHPSPDAQGTLDRLSERARSTLLRTFDALTGQSIEAETRARDAYQIGSALLKSGDYAGAIEALEASAALEPHFKTLELLGEAFLLSGEPKRAVVPLAAATTLNAQVRAPSLLAQALRALGEDVRAHEIARLALGRDAGNRAAQEVFEVTKAAYDRWTAL